MQEAIEGGYGVVFEDGVKDRLCAYSRWVGVSLPQVQRGGLSVLHYVGLLGVAHTSIGVGSERGRNLDMSSNRTSAMRVWLLLKGSEIRAPLRVVSGFLVLTTLLLLLLHEASLL